MVFDVILILIENVEHWREINTINVKEERCNFSNLHVVILVYTVTTWNLKLHLELAQEQFLWAVQIRSKDLNSLGMNWSSGCSWSILIWDTHTVFETSWQVDFFKLASWYYRSRYLRSLGIISFNLWVMPYNWRPWDLGYLCRIEEHKNGPHNDQFSN